MRSRLKKIFLLLGDVILFYLGLYLALFLRYGQSPSIELLERHLLPFSILLVIWLLSFYVFRLYHLSLMANTYEFLKLTVKNFGTAVVLSIIFFYIIGSFDNISPRTNLVIFSGVYFLLFMFWRKLFSRILSSYLPRTNLAVIGLNSQTEYLIDQIRNKPHLGYRIRFIFDPEKKEKEVKSIPVFDRASKLEELIKKKGIKTIVLNHETKNLDRLRSILFACLPLKINYVSLSEIFENITGKVPIDTINQAWFLENLSEGNKNVFDRLKRVYDFLLSFFILILTLPLYPVLALMIKLESSGPVFFKQKRVGQGQKIFTMIKFRTMTTENNEGQATKEKDKRITRFGKFLRQSRLDELPQIYNIWKGEMSFVGPRPERPEFAKELEKQIPFYRERSLVKPGITGWAQISGEYHSPSYEDTLKKLQYDLFYIKNRSIFLDLSIVLKTISIMISRMGR